MRIVDVQLDGSEEVMNPVVLNVGPIDHVLVFAANHDLPGNDNLVILVIPERALLLVPVVKGHGNGGLCDAGLAIFVDQLL